MLWRFPLKAAESVRSWRIFRAVERREVLRRGPISCRSLSGTNCQPFLAWLLGRMVRKVRRGRLALRVHLELPGLPDLWGRRGRKVLLDRWVRRERLVRP